MTIRTYQPGDEQAQADFYHAVGNTAASRLQAVDRCRDRQAQAGSESAVKLCVLFRPKSQAR